jgi:hypothetical protein
MAKNGKKQNDYKNGADFEQRFANYLVTNLGYDNYQVRNQVKSVNNSRGTNVDIIGRRLDARGKRLENLGKIYLYLTGFVAAFGILLMFLMDDKWCGTVVILIAVVIEVIAYVAVLKGIEFAFENIWVECKNLKGKADITQVRKTIDEISDYQKSGDTTYKFAEYAFVSANGFVDNAIGLAIKHGIKCYIVEDGKFKRVTNWK